MEEKKLIIPIRIKNAEGEPVKAANAEGLRIKVWTQNPHLSLAFSGQEITEGADGEDVLAVGHGIMSALESGVVQYRYAYLDEAGYDVTGEELTNIYWKNRGCVPHDIRGQLRYILEEIKGKEDCFTLGEGLTMDENRQLNVSVTGDGLATEEWVKSEFQPKGEYLTTDSATITEMEEKLEGVTKAADHYSTLNSVYVYTSGNEKITQFIGKQSIAFKEGAGIVLRQNNSGPDSLQISADTEHLATRDYVDNKINFLVNEEGILEDSFDTLKEVDTWIKEHESEAADVISDINEIKSWNDGADWKKRHVSALNITVTTDEVTVVGTTWPLDGKGSSETKANIPSATTTAAGVMSAEDKQKLDELVALSEIAIVPSSGEELSAEVNKYYRFDEPVNTLAIKLPTVEDSDKIQTLEVFLTSGQTPQISIEAEADLDYFQGFSIQPETTYELNMMWNGEKWIVAYGVIE